MDTIIWALDLCAVAYLCLWALRQDGGAPKKNEPKKNNRPKD